MECEMVGEEQADIAGIGIILGFVGQALISLILAACVFTFSKIGNLNIDHKEGSMEHKVESRRLWLISDILMVGNDIQMLLGISYMVTIFARIYKMDTYHLHFVFDIVSFVGISNAAALVFWTFCAAKITTPNSQWQSRLRIGNRKGSISLLAPRYRVTYIFAIMFLALTIILCLRLNQWNLDREPGRCYSSHLVSHAGNHPTGDLIYVITMAIWLFIGMGAAILGGPRRRRPILIFAFLQFPVHLYMALTLRTVNQEFLEDGEDENGWDFGQTTAVLLLAMSFSELVKKIYEYFKFERELQRTGMHMLALMRSRPPSRQAEDNEEGL